MQASSAPAHYKYFSTRVLYSFARLYYDVLCIICRFHFIKYSPLILVWPTLFGIAINSEQCVCASIYPSLLAVVITIIVAVIRLTQTAIVEISMGRRWTPSTFVMHYSLLLVLPDAFCIYGYCHCQRCEICSPTPSIILCAFICMHFPEIVRIILILHNVVFRCHSFHSFCPVSASLIHGYARGYYINTHLCNTGSIVGLSFHTHTHFFPE